jgi:glutaredoxin-related protein
MIIKIDIDGVIRNVISPLIRIYNKDFPDYQVGPVTHFDLSIDFPIKERIWHYFLEEKAKLCFRDAPPYYNNLQALNNFAGTPGFKIVLVSDQANEKNKEYTDYWLKENKVKYDEVIYTKHKEKVPGIILLDDKPETLDIVNKAGQIGICLTRPWNKRSEHVHVDTMSEFLNLCVFVDRYFLRGSDKYVFNRGRINLN